MPGPLRMLIALPGRLVAMGEDVARMAVAVQVLPQVLEQLMAIGGRVDRIDREVAEMHAAVEALRADVQRLDVHLEDMSTVVVPLGPAAERLGTIAGRLRRGQVPPAG